MKNRHNTVVDKPVKLAASYKGTKSYRMAVAVSKEDRRRLDKLSKESRMSRSGLAAKALAKGLRFV